MPPKRAQRVEAAEPARQSGDDSLPWTAQAGGVAIHLRLTPKGGRDAIDGVGRLADGRSVVKARVSAAPEDGKANAALVCLMAKRLGAATAAVRIVAGETSRLKKIFVAGDPVALGDALAKLAQSG